MRVTRFNRKRDLIIIRGFVWGPLHRQRRPLRLVLDTGAAETIIVPDVLDELGYNPREGEAISVMRSAVGREEGYLIRIARFDCLGHQSRDFRVHAHDLPDGWNIQGLIGLSFLRELNYEIRSLEGRILVERAAG
ncbi:MAG TPA: retropepsin-like aspartic protease [Kofleriaceae bacterium]|jgi:predicted aspartyl protease|nr:retropepsin-like aspartic protease [Kofleriaceae bacterium]